MDPLTITQLCPTGTRRGADGTRGRERERGAVDRKRAPLHDCFKGTAAVQCASAIFAHTLRARSAVASRVCVRVCVYCFTIMNM